MDHKVILEILRAVKQSDISEVEIEDGDFKLRVKRRSQEEIPAVVSYTTAAAVAPQPQSALSGAVVNEVRPTLSLPNVTANTAAAVSVNTAAAKTASETKTADEDMSKYTAIRSPMVGTFYRAPSPDKPAYVNLGDIISKGQVVGIIEAMKTFNEIESEVSGKVVQIIAQNAHPVEFDQPLFLVEPV
jgi:acetyl-CoA carboxylase biotin carboxyl carrier protein